MSPVHLRLARQPELKGQASVDNLRKKVGSPTVARSCVSRAEVGADDRNRTGDLVLTKDALCQLSYIGLRASLRPTSRPHPVLPPPGCPPSPFGLRRDISPERSELLR